MHFLQILYLNVFCSLCTLNFSKFGVAFDFIEQARVDSGRKNRSKIPKKSQS